MTLKDHSPPPTDPDLMLVMEALIRREPIFHRPAFGTTRADFEAMIVPDFWEIGASGRRYSHDYVLDQLEKRHAGATAEAWEASDFHCRRLAGDIYLLTYTLREEGERLTRRTTIWQSTDSGWRAVFHQGTIVESL